MSYGQTRRRPRAAARRLERPASPWIRLLLLLPFLAVFGLPGHDPVILGVSLVTWYQALWIIIAAGLVYTVYRLEN